MARKMVWSVGLVLFCLGLFSGVKAPALQAGEPVWDVVYQGTEMPQAPWISSRISPNSTAEIVNGTLHLADRDSGQVFYWYNRNNGTTGKTLVETRMKLVSTAQVVGSVSISFSNGANVEVLCFLPDKIQTYYSRQSYPMNTTDNFHAYRMVFQDADFKIYVDGQLRIDGTGRLIEKPKDNIMLWFGSGSVAGVGESYWEYVKSGREQ